MCQPMSRPGKGVAYCRSVLWHDFLVFTGYLPILLVKQPIK